MTDITKRMAALDGDVIVSEIFRAMDAERGKPDIEPGFYWVKNDGDVPFVAEWSGTTWLSTYGEVKTVVCRVTPPAVDDGWFTWDGIGTPPTGRVDIRYRDGDTVIENVSPEQYRWTHIDSPGDIVAYRYVR
jgi:hypothetical protein